VSARLLAAAAPVAAVVPTLWHPLGYTVEAGSLLAGLIACACVRAWTGARDKAHRWTVDLPVSALTLMFTAAAIAKLRPDPVTALIIGTGLGAVGAGIITRAKGWADRWLGDATGGKTDP
jgi:hypothetical protein